MEDITKKILSGTNVGGSIVNKILGSKANTSTGGMIAKPKAVTDIASRAKMDRNTFYSVVTKQKIKIPDNKIKAVTKSGRNFLVGEYEHNGKTYAAWKVVGKNQ